MLGLQIPVMLPLATIKGSARLMLQMLMHLFAHVLVDSQDKLVVVIKKSKCIVASGIVLKDLQYP